MPTRTRRSGAPGDSAADRALARQAAGDRQAAPRGRVVGVLSQRGRQLSKGVVAPAAAAAARLGISPNQLTVIGFLLHLPAAWAFAQGRLVTGALLLAVAAAFDALDGTLARATGQASTGGAFLDSCLDRLSEIAIFTGLLWHAQSLGPQMALLAYAAATGSVMVSYTRARSEGLGCDTRAGLFSRFERMLVLVIGLALGWLVPALVVVAAGAWLTAAARFVDALRRAHGSGA